MNSRFHIYNRPPREGSMRSIEHKSHGSLDRRSSKATRNNRSSVTSLHYHKSPAMSKISLMIYCHFVLFVLATLSVTVHGEYLK